MIDMSEKTEVKEHSKDRAYQLKAGEVESTEIKQ